MTDFFYTIVTDAINYDDAEKKAELFAIKLSDMRNWCLGEMQNAGYDTCSPFILCVIRDLFTDDAEFPYKLWRYIQDSCMPDEEESAT
jgi:hypothetical protein